MQKVVIIDCGSGNIRSCAKAFECAASGMRQEFRVEVGVSADSLFRADRIILPGQGAFRTCMQALRSMPDMVETLEEVVLRGGRPFLGICVGLQLLADYGYEHAVVRGLGWLGGSVEALAGGGNYKIPHMGWNVLRVVNSHALLPSSIEGEYVYFVHTYQLRVGAPQQLLLSCDYGEAITAMAVQDNFAGVQFHPEKSGRVGLSLLRNFLDWRI